MALPDRRQRVFRQFFGAVKRPGAGPLFTRRKRRGKSAAVAILRMSRWISEWRPEDEAFWQTKGRAVATRNLIWSIVAENIGFSVWLVWSVVAGSLPKAGCP